MRRPRSSGSLGDRTLPGAGVVREFNDDADKLTALFCCEISGLSCDHGDEDEH